MANCSIIITTTNDEAIANSMARELIMSKLVKCVQVEVVKSYYWWEEDLAEEAEYRLQLKIASRSAAKVMALIKELHNYELPEIIELAITDGNKDYLNWLLEKN